MYLGILSHFTATNICRLCGFICLKMSTYFRVVITRHLSKFDQPCQQISAPDFIPNQRRVPTTSSSWWAKSNGSAEKQAEMTSRQRRTWRHHRTFQRRSGITFPIRPLSKSRRSEYSKVKPISYFTNEFNKVTESLRTRIKSQLLKNWKHENEKRRNRTYKSIRASEGYLKKFPKLSSLKSEQKTIIGYNCDSLGYLSGVRLLIMCCLQVLGTFILWASPWTCLFSNFSNIQM